MIFSINVVWANCEPMNLVTEENSPFQKIPVFDQDGLNICYAYAASQLLDYELIKKGNKERSVHPIWAALKYAERTERSGINMGVAIDTIKAVQKYGNCPIQTINSSLSEWTLKANATEIEVMGLIEKLVTVLPTIPSEDIDATIKRVITKHAYSCAGNPTFDQLIPELRALSSMSSRTVLSNLVLTNCQSNAQNISTSSPHIIFHKTDEEVSPTLDKVLDDNKSPIALSYCSRALYESSYIGLTRTNKSPYADLKSDCSPHDSLIVGKKKIEGQCHYLLRNTWGSGFHHSNKDRKCLCKNRRTGEFIDDCEEGLHNNGENVVEGCWVSEEVFAKNSFGITHLRSK